ncbi:MAG: UDP-N-acetylmuramoyl-L-alanyl-D-glutamate--2,6-diaminopimelate ligase [Defluviitaleaceae bacterium]|nr:UDP-N-acetylmuramoyl-L-alanyl-D-glutamate--2,6-diaminopimelate ligase [Defluviitaleaceae bacterium]
MKIIGMANISNITGIAVDSRRVQRGNLFAAIRGTQVDGHDYIKDALLSGASAVLCERIPKGVDANAATFILVEDIVSALATILRDFYKDPAANFCMIGVTGTKGKTSVTGFISSILNYAGKKTADIGTLGAFLAGSPMGIPYDAPSTPDILSLYNILDYARNGGAEAVVMEATSHGLHQRRMEGITFKYGVFTNITSDHMDYHKTFENYCKAKALLFEQSEIAIANRDAEFTQQVLSYADIPKIYYGIGKSSAEKGYFAENMELLPNGVRFDVEIKGQIQAFALGIPGKFTVYNALAAISVAAEMGVAADVIAAGLAAVSIIPGRFENVKNNRGLSIIVDYAHTVDSLKNIITAVREFTKGRVITVFGCGGDRDKTKRPLMGGIAGSLSDIAVVTSDNPRSEEPVSIIADILPGMNGTSAEIITEPDRAKAIEIAINSANHGDSVIIAGKGHESYMEFENRRRIHFNDIEEVKRVLGQ